jgi:hypothetical protein
MNDNAEEFIWKCENCQKSISACEEQLSGLSTQMSQEADIL